MKKKKRKNPFEIDVLSLHKEWEKQPELYLTYAEKLAKAKRNLDRIKNQLEVIRSTVSMKIRNNPSKFGIEKVTESCITSAVLTHKKVKAGIKKVTQAKYKVDMYLASVGACDHRKKALENLVYLQGQGYYAEPHIDNETKQKMEERRKKTISKKINKRIRGK